MTSILSTSKRLPGRSHLPLVVGGDLLALVGFVSYGLYSHGLDPWLVPEHVGWVALPFVLAWLVVAPAAGLYRPDTLTSVRTTIVLLVVGWTVASLLGGAIRATPLFPGGAPVTFLLVNLAAGLVFLLPWRIAVAVGWQRL